MAGACLSLQGGQGRGYGSGLLSRGCLSLSLSLFQVYFNASLFDFRCGFAIKAKAKAKTKTFLMKHRDSKNVNNCYNTNIYSYLETPGSQSHDLYLNFVHFFNTGVN